MKQIVTTGIVLSRTDYGESDRILTILTPDQGKIRVIAKGVRKTKSKLAGGIELLSVSSITFIRGKNEIGTLISTRLEKHFGSIVGDIDRTMLAYEVLKRINKLTEDEPEEEYFELTKAALQALDDELDLALLEAWFDAQLLKLEGHRPNLETDSRNNKLAENEKYNFDFEAMCFVFHPEGRFSVEHIKLLRLIFGLSDPTKLTQIIEAKRFMPAVSQLLVALRTQSLSR